MGTETEKVYVFKVGAETHDYLMELANSRGQSIKGMMYDLFVMNELDVDDSLWEPVLGTTNEGVQV